MPLRSRRRLLLVFRVRLLLPNPDAAIPAGVRCAVRLATTEATPDADAADAPGGS